MYLIKIYENYTVDMLHSSLDMLQLHVIIVVWFCFLFL